MQRQFKCRYCGFAPAKSTQYSRHFRASPTCRQKLHNDITDALNNKKRAADIATEFGVSPCTVHRSRNGPISKQAKPANTASVMQDRMLSIGCMQKLLPFLPSISRADLVAAVEVVANEMKRLENEICTYQLELRGLRLQMQDLQRAKSKAEEERDRVLKAQNSLISSGKIKERVAKENVRRVLAEMGW